MYMYLPVIKKVPKICWKCMIVIVFWKLRKIWQLIEIWAIYLHKIGFKRGENETYFFVAIPHVNWVQSPWIGSVIDMV